MRKRFELLENRTYYLMAIPALFILFLFAYLPMPGLVIAFKNYYPIDGIFGSAWNGFENFKFYFTSQDFLDTTFNTLWINFNNIFWQTLVAVLLAVIINEVGMKRLKKTYQSLILLPYFFSAVIVEKFVYLLVSPDKGMINKIISSLGGNPVEWYDNAKYWVPILIIASLWKNVGYYVVIYLATISGIDEEMFEAANIDGASRLKQIWHIMIPHLVPTIVILTLLSIGRIFFGDFQLIYAIIQDHGQLFQGTNVIDTYIYRSIMGSSVTSGGDYGMMGAVGLYQSVMGLVLILGSNILAKKIDKDYALF